MMPAADSPTPADVTFAVFDVETTGFAATGADRIIEIAVVLQDSAGALLDEYVTLVEPGRDPGPTWVHGIDAAALTGAPTFSDVAGDLAERMAGAVLVGHNVSFDLRFLRAEFERIGHPLPVLPSVCTVSMARRLGMAAPRTLAACCDRFGIDLWNAHSALDDVRATAELMWVMSSRGCAPLDVLKGGDPEQTRPAWPTVAPSGRAHRRAGIEA